MHTTIYQCARYFKDQLVTIERADGAYQKSLEPAWVSNGLMSALEYDSCSIYCFRWRVFIIIVNIWNWNRSVNEAVSTAAVLSRPPSLSLRMRGNIKRQYRTLKLYKRTRNGPHTKNVHPHNVDLRTSNGLHSHDEHTLTDQTCTHLRTRPAHTYGRDLHTSYYMH